MASKNPNNQSNNSGGRQVTLRDIAKELGVSHVTVSLALRNHPRISKATRDRVQKKAEQMGYHPDPMLSALSHYRLTSKEKPVQAILAWINPLQNPGRLREHEEFSLYWKGAEEISTTLGFKMEEFRTEDLSLQRMDTIFRTRNIRGLLIAPLSWETTPINWNEMPWQDYAAVRFGRSRIGPPLHIVTSAQVSNTTRAFEKMQELGYKRIGFFGDAMPRRMFTAGYLRAQLAQPEEFRLPMALYNTTDVIELRSLLKKWIAANRPDAIMTDSSMLPTLLNDLGIKIPDDIGIATTSIHDTPINAGIDQRPLEIGKSAVRMLVSLMNEHHFGIPETRNHILVEGKWVNGSMLPDRS